MADDFLGSIAQEDVEFVTEIVKSVNPGDNYKHLAVYTDNSMIATGATLVAVKDAAGTTVGYYSEVTSANYKDIVKGALEVWITDYFAAGGKESVFIINVVADPDDDYSKAALTACFAVTHQWAYFKTICIADEDVVDKFHLDPTAAANLAELCATDDLLSSVPFFPMSMGLNAGAFTDTAYSAVNTAGFDAFWVYHLPVAVTSGSSTVYTVHNGALIALGLALSVVNGSGLYVGNSMDMVATDAISASGVDGKALDVTSQSILKAANVAYFKPVGDTSGLVALRGGVSHKNKTLAAEWIVSYCNYYNKCMVANYLSRRNVFKNAATYAVLLNIVILTVSKFVTSGRLNGFSITAPAYEDLPTAASDEIVVPNAWRAEYQDDLRTVKVYGTLYI